MSLILLVDDDCEMVRLLQVVLGRHETIHAADGRATLHLVTRQPRPDLVLLDLKLPDIDGVLLITMIRALSQVPVIVLSARDGQVDRVQALRNGADDFIGKPFDIYDLEARIDAVLRRSWRPPVEEVELDGHVGDLLISDAKGARILGKSLHLTHTEYRLLAMLVEHKGRVATTDEITQRLWATSDVSTGHLLAVHVMRLRRRLREAHGPEVMTVRGKGFLLVNVD